MCVDGKSFLKYASMTVYYLMYDGLMICASLKSDLLVFLWTSHVGGVATSALSEGVYIRFIN